MSDKTNNIEERRQRLHDWFVENPEVWKDISEELETSLHNESIKLTQRNPTSREWSAGYVFAYGEVLDIERYFRKVWKVQTAPQHK